MNKIYTHVYENGDDSLSNPLIIPLIEYISDDTIYLLSAHVVFLGARYYIIRDSAWLF